MDNTLEEIKKYFKDSYSNINEGATPTNEPTEDEKTDVEPTEETPAPEEDPSIGGGGAFGGEEPEKLTITELGRVYTLKKIFHKLLIINNILLENNDSDLNQIKNMVKNSLELFTLVIDNIQLYKEQIDDIILKYYKFLERLITILNKYYKIKRERQAEYDSNKTSLSDDGILDEKEKQNLENDYTNIQTINKFK